MSDNSTPLGSREGEESGRGNKKATPTSKWLRRLRPQINPTLVVGGDVKEMKKRPERGCPRV